MLLAVGATQKKELVMPFSPFFQEVWAPALLPLFHPDASKTTITEEGAAVWTGRVLDLLGTVKGHGTTQTLVWTG